MAIDTKAIKQKIGSVGNIQKITKTMEMVSVSKMRRALARVVLGKRYAKEALMLLVNLVEDNNISHSLLEKKTKGKDLVVIISSNKGLCGGYNTNISRAFGSFIKDKNIEEINILPLGIQSQKIAKRFAVKALPLQTISDAISVSEVESLTKFIIQTFLEGEYKNVYILYTEFIKTMNYNAFLRPLLPLSVDSLNNIISEEKKESMKEKQKKNPYIFEPSPEEVAETVIERLISATIYQMLLESVAAEHSSRMVAMQNATENAGRIKYDLELTFNKARQAAITQEISEIVNAAEAVG
ncbi:MAG: F-type H+-transporting ATPase subunit gamma [Flavobacteriaceae bacterium]|jgi:F-type H+-transporting ATPase subunit gamma